MKTPNAGISRNFAEYAGISRNITEFRGISRNFAEYRGSCRICPCVLCISHSLGLYLLHQILLKREPEGRVMIVALRAPSLAKFGEVDTVPVSEKCDNPRMTRY